ncbi:MAG: hypothetical protein KJ879_03635 [Nanoarchaeota archaeon]|nr:hypothetical protein [Nanoarchaeota archaeon]
MKRGSAVLLLLVLVLSLSLVSAGWFSDFFGKVTGRTTETQNLVVISDPCDSDFDGNGTVDNNDYVAFSAHYGEAVSVASGTDKYDLNGNGQIDFADYVIFAKDFGTVCVVSTPITPTCTDSDGGKNNNTQGTIHIQNSSGDYTFKDYCMTGSSEGMLVEYTCYDQDNIPSGSSGVRGDVGWYYSCLNGCSNGACVNDTSVANAVVNVTVDCPDFDGDGIVNDADYELFSDNYNELVTPETMIYDLNSDGEIDFSDYVIFAKNFGKTCTTSQESAISSRYIIKQDFGKTILEHDESSLNLGGDFSSEFMPNFVSSQISGAVYFESLTYNFFAGKDSPLPFRTSVIEFSHEISPLEADLLIDSMGREGITYDIFQYANYPQGLVLFASGSDSSGGVCSYHECAHLLYYSRDKILIFEGIDKGVFFSFSYRDVFNNFLGVYLIKFPSSVVELPSLSSEEITLSVFLSKDKFDVGEQIKLK